MSDRIVLMNEGADRPGGEPREIYDAPGRPLRLRLPRRGQPARGRAARPRGRRASRFGSAPSGSWRGRWRRARPRRAPSCSRCARSGSRPRPPTRTTGCREPCSGSSSSATPSASWSSSRSGAVVTAQVSRQAGDALREGQRVELGWGLEDAVLMEPPRGAVSGVARPGGRALAPAPARRRGGADLAGGAVPARLRRRPAGDLLPLQLLACLQLRDRQRLEPRQLLRGARRRGLPQRLPQHPADRRLGGAAGDRDRLPLRARDALPPAALAGVAAVPASSSPCSAATWCGSSPGATLLGEHGFINESLLSLGIVGQPLTFLLYNRVAAVIVLANFLVPLAILPIYGVLQNVDEGEVLAARDLGCGSAGAFRRVTLPLAWPGIAAALALTFIIAAADYLTPTLVGGVNGTMIGQTIATTFLDSFDWPAGAAISFVTLALTLLIVAVVRAGRQPGAAMSARRWPWIVLVAAVLSLPLHPGAGRRPLRLQLLRLDQRVRRLQYPLVQLRVRERRIHVGAREPRCWPPPGPPPSTSSPGSARRSSWCGCRGAGAASSPAPS